MLRRYAPGSVKFDDAKPAPLAEIRPGDQLRARGEKNADGSELTAQEIVSGSFRNISGTISSLDSAQGTITVHDLATKKNVDGENYFGVAAAQIARADGATHRATIEWTGA